MAPKSSDLAYEKFKKLLFSATLRAGQFVTQKELLDHLQISLGPIRTALARLEAEGFIQILPQRGVQIVEPSIALYRNITQVRIALEKEAWARFAAQADAAVLVEMERAHKNFLERAEQNLDMDLLREASTYDQGMHDTVVAALDNALYLHIFRINFERTVVIRPSPERGHIKPTTFHSTMQEHLEIIHTCMARDPAAAAAALETHLMSGFHRFVTL